MYSLSFLIMFLVGCFLFRYLVLDSLMNYGVDKDGKVIET